MEDLNLDREIKITFTDVMRIIADDNTTPEQKMVYIYLLNVIMDLDERVTNIEKKIDNPDK